MHILDIIAVVCYFLLVMAVGFYSMFRSNRGTISGYFLAGRFMTWLPVGASLFASNIGSEHFIGLAGSGAASGIGVGAFELNALLFLQLLGFVFLPVYVASGCHTLPEFMRKRFGGQRIRVYLAVLSMVLYIFTKVSVNMYAGSLFVRIALGWNIYYAVLLVLAMTALCTVTGGLAAVIYTDTLQCFLMLAGGVSLGALAMLKVGGLTGLFEQYPKTVPNATTLAALNLTGCGVVPNVEKSFRMLREPSDPDFPWPGFLFGQSPASIWYWAADQMMVQRVLASKSLSHAQGATLFAGYLKILPLFMMVLPGMASRVLFQDEIGCIGEAACMQQCGNPKSCTNFAYPYLVLKLLPPGVRGIMLAVMLSALMSDLTSIFNSSSTLFTIDIWHRIRKEATPREMLIVGRMWVLVMVVVSFLWVPVIEAQQGGQLFIYIQVISADLSPPIAAVYLLATLWKRTNEPGAFWGLIVGFAVGICRMVLEFIQKAPECGQEDTRMFFAKIHYMYFAVMLFWITVFVTVSVSLLTKPVEEFRLIRTTYWTRKEKRTRADDHRIEVNNEADVLRPRNTADTDSVEMQSRKYVDADTPPCVQQQSTSIVTSASECVVKGYNWFCGYDYTPKGQMDLAQFEDHLQQITTLKQSKRVKWLLHANLMLLIIICVSMFMFFSYVTPKLAEAYY